MQPRCKSPRPVPVAPVGTGIRPLLKVFTGRFGPGTGEVLFDRICRENGIKHLLTAPRSPTTTGKVERFHKTLRREFLTGEVFGSIEEAQAALDAWVQDYNHDRPHQSIGMVAPFERFRLAAPEPVEATAAAAPDNDPAPAAPTAPAPAATTRRVGANGLISFAAAKYRAGVWLAGQDVTVVGDGGLVQLQHRGVLVATHARRHSLDKQAAGQRRANKRPSPRRPSPTAASGVGLGGSTPPNPCLSVVHLPEPECRAGTGT